VESGLRAATTQLENRQRRFRLWLLRDTGDCGGVDKLGRRLTNVVAYTGQVESTVLSEEPETLNAPLLKEEEGKEAKAEAEKTRPGLTMFTDGSRMEDGAAGYVVAWKKGVSWVGIKTRMGCNQEAFGTECVALARALEETSRRITIPERVTIFSDAQAAIRRMASDEPGPGQLCALQTRKHIATLRKDRPGIIIETRWCPAHMGFDGNEKDDEWEKMAADQPDTRGVEWLRN